MGLHGANLQATTVQRKKSTWINTSIESTYIKKTYKANDKSPNNLHTVLS